MSLVLSWLFQSLWTATCFSAPVHQDQPLLSNNGTLPTLQMPPMVTIRMFRMFRMFRMMRVMILLLIDLGYWFNIYLYYFRIMLTNWTPLLTKKWPTIKTNSNTSWKNSREALTRKSPNLNKFKERLNKFKTPILMILLVVNLLVPKNNLVHWKKQLLDNFQVTN